MMDLLATVPYYTAYLSRALEEAGANLIVGSISYYLDSKCFSSRGIKLRPGCSDMVGRFSLPKGPRRILKLLELGLNLSALIAKFVLRPPKIVHIQFLPLLRWPAPFDLWFVYLCQKRGSRLVLTVHDLLPHDTGERHKAVFLRLYRRMDALICHSEHIKGRLGAEFGVQGEKITVIPHGPFFYDEPPLNLQEARTQLGIAAGHPIVLWQGILFPYKGLDVLLQAWQRVEAENSTAHLLVLGTGAPDLLEAVREQVRSLGLQRVTLDLRFLSTEELTAAYRAADIVTYPYRAITTSGALATGLALGKAIVASDLPVFRESLTDGENALLVPAGNPADLAFALLRLLGDRALRLQFVARVNAMHFGAQSWISIADKTLDVYRGVLGG